MPELARVSRAGAGLQTRASNYNTFDKQSYTYFDNLSILLVDSHRFTTVLLVLHGTGLETRAYNINLTSLICYQFFIPNARRSFIAKALAFIFFVFGVATFKIIHLRIALKG